MINHLTCQYIIEACQILLSVSLYKYFKAVELQVCIMAQFWYTHYTGTRINYVSI